MKMVNISFHNVQNQIILVNKDFSNFKYYDIASKIDAISY